MPACPKNRVVRLKGKALAELREQCWERDNGRCRECGTYCYWSARWEADAQAFDMAHIKSRGAGGSDTLENVRTLCHKCHMHEHNAGRLK